MAGHAGLGGYGGYAGLGGYGGHAGLGKIFLRFRVKCLEVWDNCITFVA